MTGHLSPALSLLVLQVWSTKVYSWCFYPCPKSLADQTLCAVDSKAGAMLFPSTCHMWKMNYCQRLEYRPLDMHQCLQRFPHVVDQFLTTSQFPARFDKLRDVFGVRPFRRFFILFSLISSLVPRPPMLPVVPLWPSINYPSYPQNPKMWSPLTPPLAPLPFPFGG